MAKKSSPSARAKTRLRGHVIPNSHLDREWTLEYQQTRRLTVEFLDSLLDILDQVPEYTFLLDSQTVPLEDYLEIRPENEGRIRAAIEAGRMTIGPWYTAPDCNMISGESIVRNLLVGDRTARRFGRPMNVGYTPFGFGQVSQLPQIYAGFGIRTMFFYRGISNHESPESEFLWTAPDGTTLLCSRFGTKARYNFFMDVWRPVAYGRDAKARIYHWDRGDVPIKRISADREFDHYFVRQPELELHKDVLEESFRKLLEVETKHFTTPVIPLMQGMDSTRPHPLEAQIVRELQAMLGEGEDIFFSTLEKYAEELRQYLDLEELRQFRGEMRHLGPPSPLVTGLEHIASGRVRQKIAHNRAERHLTRLAEPFAALVWAAAGAPYPKTSLDLAWKQLLQCQPHDTVAGCGIDKVETDAHYKLDQVRCLSDIVLDDALAELAVRIDTSNVDPNEIVVTVFNPSPRPRTEVVDAYVDISDETGMVDFEVTDAEGKPVDFTFVHRKRSEKTVRDNSDLTTALVGWMCKIQLVAKDVPGMGWRTYVVRKAGHIGRMERIARNPYHLENENLILEVNPDGTIDVVEKPNGRRWSGLHYFVDNGENGNGWEHRAPGIERLIGSRGKDMEISLEENTALSATVRVAFTLRVPSGIEHNDSYHYARRSDLIVDVPVESTFTLRKGARRIDVRTVIDNKANNHRLRVFFPTGLSKATHSAAETAYDVVRRKIDRDRNHSYAQAPNPQYPMLRFVDVSDPKAGLAIVTEGLHMYEVTDDPSRTIAITLLRAYEVTLCTVSYRWERRPDQELSQVPGKIESRYAIVPHDGDWEKGNVMRETEDFHLPLIPTQSGKSKNGSWPTVGSLAELQPDSLNLSAAKRAEDRDALIVRVHNPGSRTEKATLTFPADVEKAQFVNMNEQAVEGLPAARKTGSKVSFDIAAGKILSLEVVLASGHPKAKKAAKKSKKSKTKS